MQKRVQTYDLNKKPLSGTHKCRHSGSLFFLTTHLCKIIISHMELFKQEKAYIRNKHPVQADERPSLHRINKSVGLASCRSNGSSRIVRSLGRRGPAIAFERSLSTSPAHMTRQTRRCSCAILIHSSAAVPRRCSPMDFLTPLPR